MDSPSSMTSSYLPLYSPAGAGGSDGGDNYGGYNDDDDDSDYKINIKVPIKLLMISVQVCNLIDYEDEYINKYMVNNFSCPSSSHLQHLLYHIGPVFSTIIIIITIIIIAPIIFRFSA